MSDLWDDVDEADLDGEYDEPTPDEFDDLTDDERARAFELLHGPQPSDKPDPLDFYATPVTRKRKPNAEGRAVHDVLRSL